MSYDDRETSAYAGAPVELYRFARGPGDAWLYTSADESITYNNETYQPVSISRDQIQQTQELAKANIQITVPRDNAFAVEFVEQPPDTNVSLTIYRQHRGANGGTIAFWKGRALSVSWAGSQATIKAESIITSLKRQGLRPRYQYLCRHALYGVGCGVDNRLFRADGVVNSIDGATITAAAWDSQADGWFKAGYVQFGEGGPRRLIRDHSGATLTLSAELPGLAIGDTVSAYAGCDHTIDTCGQKFSNYANFGGFRYIPSNNPFGSNGA